MQAIIIPFPLILPILFNDATPWYRSILYLLLLLLVHTQISVFNNLIDGSNSVLDCSGLIRDLSHLVEVEY
jgi:hypothetical protein